MIRGTFTATDCEFRANESIESAGGVGVFGVSSIFNAVRCDFIENTTNNGGGGVAVIKGTFNAEFCLFEGNVADSNGGAVYIDSSASFIANSCYFVENVQTFYRNWERPRYGGGAIYIN
jgi:predicted outer membrane repeat protein